MWPNQRNRDAQYRCIITASSPSFTQTSFPFTCGPFSVQGPRCTWSPGLPRGSGLEDKGEAPSSSRFVQSASQQHDTPADTNPVHLTEGAKRLHCGINGTPLQVAVTLSALSTRPSSRATPPTYSSQQPHEADTPVPTSQMNREEELSHNTHVCIVVLQGYKIYRFQLHSSVTLSKNASTPSHIFKWNFCHPGRAAVRTWNS